jgi:hypothetical protein
MSAQPCFYEQRWQEILALHEQGLRLQCLQQGKLNLLETRMSPYWRTKTLNTLAKAEDDWWRVEVMTQS